MVPMHFGYNQIVHFTGPRSAQLLTKMHDYHTYKDNGQTYSATACMWTTWSNVTTIAGASRRCA